MESDLDYDRAWKKVSQQFWHRRRRELGLHIALFVGAHLLTFFIPNFLGDVFSANYSPFAFMQYLGIYNIPYTTVNWGIILTIHFVVLIGAGLGERIFQYSVERELLRNYARLNNVDEKRKMRPPYSELADDGESLEIVDDAWEKPYAKRLD